MIALIAVVAVVASVAHTDATMTYASDTTVVVDFDHEHTSDTHAHGCGTCHFHANLRWAGFREPLVAQKGFRVVLGYDFHPLGFLDPLLRPPSA